MYVRMYVCTCMRAYMHACMHGYAACVSIYRYTCTNTCTYVHSVRQTYIQTDRRTDRQTSVPACSVLRHTKPLCPATCTEKPNIGALLRVVRPLSNLESTGRNEGKVRKLDVLHHLRQVEKVRFNLRILPLQM